MSRVHFLNVNEGDCSVIEHNSGHISVSATHYGKLAVFLDFSLYRTW